MRTLQSMLGDKMTMGSSEERERCCVQLVHVLSMCSWVPGALHVHTHAERQRAASACTRSMRAR
eukprot:724688-Pelagomonas_calceolata.AAC.8